MIKNIALVSFLTVSALSNSALAVEVQKDQKDYYFQVNGGGSYGTIPKGDFSGSAKSGWSSVWGAEIGYKFDDNFRAGLELSYRPNFTPKDTSAENKTLQYKGKNVQSNKVAYSKYQVKSFTVMTNIYYDILTIHNITPYATVGAGLARNTVRETEVMDSTLTLGRLSKSGTIVSKSTTSKNSFAYKLGLGTKYAFNKDFDFDLRYQYVNLGEIKASSTKVSSQENGKLYSQEVILGIAYKF